MAAVSPETRKRLQYAEGWMALGRLEEAGAELDGVALADRSKAEFKECKMALLYGREDWRGLADIAEACIRMFPDRAQGWISLAFARRRLAGVAAAREVLLEAEAQLGEASAILSYNLACYHCLLGKLDAARKRLRQAFHLAPMLLAQAKEDPDLAALRGELDEIG